jgi:hypothetical protein
MVKSKALVEPQRTKRTPIDVFQDQKPTAYQSLSELRQRERRNVQEPRANSLLPTPLLHV